MRESAIFDWLIVGAGFAGSTLAERIATIRRERVLLIDRRPHIGGNAYDLRDAAGVMIHKYGPHIFHTNSSAIFQYLSRFTRWREYQHRVLAWVDGMLFCGNASSVKRGRTSTSLRSHSPRGTDVPTMTRAPGRGS